LALQTVESELGGVIGLFYLVCALLELDAFAVVGFFHGRWEWWWDGAGCALGGARVS
jgi:hypothetical protein